VTVAAVINQMMIEEGREGREEVFSCNGVHNLLCNDAADYLEMHVKCTGSTG